MNCENIAYLLDQVALLAKMSLSGWVFIAIIILAILSLFVGFHFPKKNELPSLHGNAIEMYLVLSIFIFICCVNGICFFWICINVIRHGEIISASLFLTPSILLFLIVLAHRSIYNWSTNRHIHRIQHHFKIPTKKTSDLVRAILQSMDISTEVVPIYSNTSDVSPHVIGSSKRCYIVFPENYDQLIHDTCDDENLKEGLSRLIISHELAHIKNKDLLIMPTYWSITKAFKWFCMISAILYFITYFIAPSSIVTVFAQNLMGLNIAVYGFLYFFLKYILSKREQYADAVATLSTHPEIVNQLISEFDNKPSPLELFIFSVISPSPLNKFCFGYAVGKRYKNKSALFFPKQLNSFRLSYLERARMILSKSIALNSAVLTFKEIFFAAAGMAIVFAMIRFVRMGMITNYLLSLCSLEEIKQEFLTSGAMVYNQYNWSNFNLLLNIMMSFISANFLVMYYTTTSRRKYNLASKLFNLIIHLKQIPLSEQNNPFKKMRGMISVFPGFIYYFFYCCVYLFVFNCFLKLIPEFNWKPFLLNFKWMHLSPHGIAHLVIWILLIHILILLKSTKQYFPNQKICFYLPQRIAVDIDVFKTIVFVLSGFLICSVYFWGGSSLSLLAKAPLAISAGTLALFASQAMLLFSRHDFIRSECLIYQRILWRRSFFSLPITMDSKDTFCVSKGIVVDLILTFIIPLCLLLFLGDIALKIFDSWYFSNIERWADSWHEISWNTPYQTRPGAIRTIFLIATRSYIGANKIPPSTALMLATSTILLGIAIVVVLAFYKNKSQECLQKIRLLNRLSRLLGNEMIIASRDRKYFENKILSKCSSQTPYIRGIESIPLMISTCDAVLFINASDPNNPLLDDLCKWIQLCMSEKGGFSPIPGIQPDIYHTWAALTMLHEIGRLETSEIIDHNKWLKEQLHKFMNYDDSRITDQDWLFCAENLVTSISLTTSGHGFSAKETEWLSQLAYQKWRSISNMPLYTKLFIKILKGSSFPISIYRNLIMQWFQEHECTLTTLSPKLQLAEIIEFIEIIYYLDPAGYRNRESVMQAIDNINGSSE